MKIIFTYKLYLFDPDTDLDSQNDYNDPVPLDYDMDGDGKINYWGLVSSDSVWYTPRLVSPVNNDPNINKDSAGNLVSDDDIDGDGLDIENGIVKDFDKDADGMSDYYEFDHGMINGGWQNMFIHNARYAVVVVGGGTEPAGTLLNGNHDAFWNDGMELYDKLASDYRYIDENIYLLHSHGWRTDERDWTTDSRWDGAATWDAINNTFNNLKYRMSVNDFFFFVEICHGGDASGSVIFKNSPNQAMYFNPTVVADNPERALSYQLDKLRYARMCVILQSCFPGGREYLYKADRIVITASAPEQYTYAECHSDAAHWAFIHEGRWSKTIDDSYGFVIKDLEYFGFTLSLGDINSPQPIAHAFDKGAEATQYNYVETVLGDIWDDARSTPEIQAPYTANAWHTYL